VTFTPLRTVRGRLVLAALLIELVMLALLVGNSLRLLREAMGEQAREQAEQIAPVLGAALVAPLAQSDYATVQAVLDESHAIRGIEYLAVTDASGLIVATSGLSGPQALPKVDGVFSLDGNQLPPRYDLALPIKLAGQNLGTLQFGLDLSRIAVARKNLLHQGIVIAAGELLLSAALLSVFGLLITRQLSVLTAASLTVAAGQLAPARVPEGPDDVGRLGAAFNTMSRAIAERVEQLTRANEQTARVAASLQERNAQINAIFDLSPDGFVAFDAAGRVALASPAFFRLTGLDATQVAALSESDFSDRLAAVCAEQARFPGVAALRAGLLAARLHAADSSEGPSAPWHRQLIEIPGSPAAHKVLEVGLSLSDAESVSEILFFRDVTHETEVDRMKSEFLSHAAHELRTPMSSIFGFSEMLMRREFAPAKRQEIVGIIHRQSEQMVAIINELLDLVRIDDRRGQDFEFAPLDAAELLTEVIADFGVPAGQQPARFEAPAAATWVQADKKKLIQAVRNILSNAYKYSPEGGQVLVCLVSDAGDIGQPPARVGLRIQDHGMGMTPEQVARVFERFYRADASGNIPGTGLGMSIVKEIIELHGGEVEFASVIGVGTTVTLWVLPASPAT
jgi:signal transduction histidine kinase/HAMP domain-containing protein